MQRGDTAPAAGASAANDIASAASGVERMDIELKGDVELENVTFAYPGRLDRLVLKECCLRVPAGTSCALVSCRGRGNGKNAHRPWGENGGRTSQHRTLQEPVREVSGNH